MKFSLLLCTLNREALLQKCVKSLLEQSFGSYEIIIVDQSESINNAYNNIDKIKYIHITEKGLSHARNIGLNEASGDYICLIDDDAVYTCNYLENADAILNNVGMAAIICGKVIDPDTGEFYLEKTKTDKLQYISYLSAFSYCASASMIIRRDILSDGFDERFGIGSYYGSGEETDIVFNALEKEETIMFCPNLILYHKAPSKECSTKKLYDYSIGTGGLFKKYYCKCSKIKYLGLFCFSLCRSFFGCLLYVIGFKQHKKSTIILRGKITGFMNYKDSILD